MRHYEICFLVHPDQSEQVPAMLERYRSLVEAAEGKIHRVEDWGRRQLAYPINKKEAGYYLVVECLAEGGALDELERQLRLADDIVRHKLIRLPEAETTEVAEQPAEQIDIMITETGTFLVNGRELINSRVETIRNALQKVSGGDNTLPLTISADANARHQDVVTAMDVAGRLGFSRISIATVDSPESQ